MNNSQLIYYMVSLHLIDFISWGVFDNGPLYCITLCLDARGLASFDKNHNKCYKIELIIYIRKIYVQKKDCNKIGTLVSFSMLWDKRLSRY
jgi:hypothetical protein